jgi:primosomal protein N' (replication factor Y)
MASVTGPRDAVDTLLSRLDVADAEILGPVPVDVTEQGALVPGVRALVRVPRSGGASLARALSASLGVRSARREGGTVRVQMDPAELG